MVELELECRQSDSTVCALKTRTMLPLCFIRATRKLDMLYQGTVITIHGVPTVYQDGEGTSESFEEGVVLELS